MQRLYRNAAIAVLALVVLILARSPLLLERLQQAMISTGPNGPETPASIGLAYERLKIPSGARTLDAYLVEAASTCPMRTALLIFHGVGETSVPLRVLRGWALCLCPSNMTMVE